MYYFDESCRIVDSILRGGAYSSIKLSQGISADNKDRALIYKIVQGVVQNSLLLDYQIAKLCKKRPKPAVATIIKVALYCIHFLNIPDYAIVSNALKYAEKSGKKSLKPLINAVMSGSKLSGLIYPDKDDSSYFIVKYSINPSLYRLLKNTYKDDTEKILDSLNSEAAQRHIRAAGNNEGDNSGFFNKLDSLEVAYQRTETGACVNLSELYKHNDTLDGKYSVMSYGSTLIAGSVIETARQNDVDVKHILDACAAPGGKSVFMAEKLPQSIVTSCDVHEHRIELIRSYMRKYSINNIKTMQINNAEYYANFKNAFGIVLCDVPCSGIGTAHRKPEIKLFRTDNDVYALADTAYSILCNCANYVSGGGMLFYSTCTITHQENDEVVDRFLNNHTNFKRVKTSAVPERVQDGDYLRMVNGINASEGYFLAAFVKSI